jgi:hypothetical protein
MAENLGAYNDTQGFVRRDTSIARTTYSLDLVEEHIYRSMCTGVTWKELADKFNIHHGTASGALSNLHKQQRVFVVRGERRGNCGVYVSAKYRHAYAPEERLDEPVRTKASLEREALEAVIEAATEVVAQWGTPISLSMLDDALNNYLKGVEK